MKRVSLDPVDKAWLDSIMPENDEFVEILGRRDTKMLGLSRSKDTTLRVDVVIRKSLVW